ncbi:MAG: ketol-acid reductoisomerase [bacterium]
MSTQRPIFYDTDADLKFLADKKIAVIGYGAQGRAQARMLFESGINIVVGVRENGKSWDQVIADGLPVATIGQASKDANVIHILIPDENQKEVFEKEIQANLNPGDILSFSHGFNIVFNRIAAPAGVGVIMVAPKAPGTEEYKCYKQGFGVPALFSVEQENADVSAKNVALAMAKAMFFTRAGAMECTFKEECFEDLFGEQAVLCGGTAELVKAGFEVLVERGYPPEFAYFECLHELKLIVDLIYEGGLEKMREVVSNTAEFGGHTRGPRVITSDTKEAMRQILTEVEDGTFAKEFLQEMEENKGQGLIEMRRKESEHPIEVTGRRIRAMFKKS